MIHRNISSIESMDYTEWTNWCHTSKYEIEKSSIIWRTGRSLWTVNVLLFTYIYLLITEERCRETAKTECFLWLSKRAIRLAIIVEIKTQNPLMQFKMYLFFLQSLHNFYNKINNQKKINRRLRFANALYRDFVSKEEKSVVCAGLHKSSPQLSLQVATSYIIYCRFVIRSQATPLPYQPI